MRNLGELVVVAKSVRNLEEILKIPLVRKATNPDSPNFSFIENWLRELLNFIERVEVICLDTNNLRNDLLSNQSSKKNNWFFENFTKLLFIFYILATLKITGAAMSTTSKKFA